eukprot:TRINITY_DN49795_c0_g1_i1.p1 TRINITY_DN49795_c0_g1~~TRINITY_DN49795_c0_g1_i1.p1  ORF type:complete len:499 (-),score=142.27 TRINITY_DN49795_c0_g1_i1:59-1555(-)
MGSCGSSAPKPTGKKAADPPCPPRPSAPSDYPEWELYDDAVRIFHLADGNKNGRLEMKELAKALKNKDFAKARMGQMDKDMNGVVTEDEWVAYIKRVYDQHPESATAMLEQFERDIVDWPLRGEAVRIFRLIDSNKNGMLDVNELALDKALKSANQAKSWMRYVDSDRSGDISEEEWERYIKSIYDKRPESAAAVLKWYEDRHARHTCPEPLRTEAVRIFKLADLDGNGVLDRREVAEVLKSEQFATAWVKQVDTDRNTVISEDEWVAYIKGVHDSDANSATALLQMYERILCEWPLRSEALRIFRLADTNGDGVLDVQELADVRKTDDFTKDWMTRVDTDLNGEISEEEWMAYIKSVYKKKPDVAAALLQTYEQRLREASLRMEAMRIFRLADKDGNGNLDAKELEAVLKSEDFAKAMMGRADADLNGFISEDEWIAYIKGIYEESVGSATAVLKLLEQHISKQRPGPVLLGKAPASKSQPLGQLGAAAGLHCISAV